MSDHATPADPSSDPAAAAPPRHRRRRRLKVAGLVAAVLALVLVAVAGVAYTKLDGNLEVTDVRDQLFDRPEKSVAPVEDEGEEPREALNILVIGSDTRQGVGNGIDDENPGQRSDTTILLHLSADRTFAYGVSIARDTIVERPDCRAEDGTLIPGDLDMWNAAYEEGGAACLVQQTEQLTDVRVDDFVEVDFSGFRQMVDALGGVTVCVPEEVDDTTGNIYLPQGTYEVQGQQALDYVRVRYAISQNGDIGRMKRQQTFIASMANKALSAGTLANPIKLYSFLDAATSSLTISSGLGSLGDLAGLARQFQGIGLDRIQFTTVPIEPYEPDPNRLQWRTEEAQALFTLMRNDQPLSDDLAGDVVSAAESVPGATPSSDASPSPSASDSSASPSEPATPEQQAEREAAAEEAAARAAENGLCA